MYENSVPLNSLLIRPKNVSISAIPLSQCHLPIADENVVPQKRRVTYVIARRGPQI